VRARLHTTAPLEPLSENTHDGHYGQSYLRGLADNELAKGEPAGRGVASLLRLGPVPRNGTPAFRFLVRLLGCSRGLLAGFSEASAARLAGLQPPPSKAQGNLEDYDAPLIDH
jgi:hypothetical protein